MKIGHFILSLGTGGAEKLLVDVLPKYDHALHETTIIQLSSILESKSYVDSVKVNNIELVTLSKGALRNPFLIFKLIKHINKNRYDVLHVHLFPTLYFVSLASMFLKYKPAIVFTEHSISNGRNNRQFLKGLERYVYSKYDAVIAISDKIESMLKKWIGDTSEVILIKNGIDTAAFKLAAHYDKEYFLANYNIPYDAVKVMMTARFSYPKDHKTIIDAFKMLPAHYHLLLVGEGDNKIETMAYTEREGLSNRVIFLGFRADVANLAKSVDINVLSTLYEGMSGVALEGLASGKPFIGTNIVGINDIVPGKEFLFEKQNSKDLAFKIRSIIDNQDIYNEMCDRGLACVAKYDVSLMISKHISLYTSLTAKNG